MLLESKKHQKYFLLILSLLVTAGLWILFLLSDGLRGGMDSYNHYLIARFSIEHPELLLHYWGKPLYNITAAPFAQLGLKGSVLLNIISLVGAAFFSYLTAEKLKMRYSFLVYVLVLLSPVMLDNTISSLTEPLNALLLSVAVYLFAANRLYSAVALTGFLPFARTEGFVIVGVIIIYLILFAKNYKALLLLLLGSVVFNFIGWAVEGEMLWIIKKNPYIKYELSGDNICGSGSFMHYFKNGHITFGFFTCVAMVIGLFAIVRQYFKTWKFDVLGLIAALFVGYFAAHAFIWGAGMMGSCGYIRVMVVIAPLAAILAVHGIEQLSKRLKPKLVAVLLIFLCLNALYAPYRYYAHLYPVRITKEQQMYVELNDWFQQSEYTERTLVYMYPYFSMLADIDPWDRVQHEELWMTSLPYLKKGDLIFWDGHFGPNEAGIPLTHLKDNPDYRLIHSIIPEKSFKTSNGYDFEIYVFEKLTENES